MYVIFRLTPIWKFDGPVRLRDQYRHGAETEGTRSPLGYGLRPATEARQREG
jgi:hypothetical protein